MHIKTIRDVVCHPHNVPLSHIDSCMVFLAGLNKAGYLPLIMHAGTDRDRFSHVALTARIDVRVRVPFPVPAAPRHR